jgi:membrane associated rhomboid family serine protease
MGNRGGNKGGSRMGSGGGGGYQMQSLVPVTPVVKWLIIANVAIWLVFQVILERYVLSQPFITEYFGLIPGLVFQKFFVWQVGTYMFLHSYNVFHILFNMLMLWWLGAELEQRWGPKFFLAYYLVSGIGAGVLYVLGILGYTLITGSVSGLMTPVIGASGAVFGLLLAYGIIFGERIVYFLMVFPMRAKYFVMILGAVEVMNLVNGGSDVANLAHLGGIASGYVFLKLYTKFQQGRWRKKASPRGRGLRLVVDNENKKKDGPKYWN